MNLREAIIAEIGEEELNRIGRWLEEANDRFKGQQLTDYERTRKALLMLNRQTISPKTLIVITNMVLDADWVFPLPEHPRTKWISHMLQSKFLIEMHYLDGIAYFHVTDKPWSFADALRNPEPAPRTKLDDLFDSVEEDAPDNWWKIYDGNNNLVHVCRSLDDCYDWAAMHAEVTYDDDGRAIYR